MAFLSLKGSSFTFDFTPGGSFFSDLISLWVLFFRKALTGLAVRILSLSSKAFFLLEETNLGFDYDFFLEDSAFWVLVTGLMSNTNECLLSSSCSS